MTGICAGNKNKVNLGNIIIADKALDCETGKKDINGFHREISPCLVKPQLVQQINDFNSKLDLASLTDELQKPKTASDQPKIHLGTYFTGSPVVSRQGFFEELMEIDRKALAYDMEASAFLEAVTGHSANLTGVVVKGVCDHADNEKNDEFHEYAADVAARWMLEFCKSHLVNLKNIPEKNTTVFSVELPRPAKTIEDRKKWRNILQWPSDYEEDFARNNYGADSGMVFYGLDSHQYLLEISLGLLPYQARYLYLYIDERNSIPSWKLINFRKIYDVTSEQGSDITLEESEEYEIIGLADFETKHRELTVFTKARGIGDCGSLATYKIMDGSARLTQLKIRSCDDTLIEEALDLEHPSEHWPLVDISINYPPYQPCKD